MKRMLHAVAVITVVLLAGMLTPGCDYINDSGVASSNVSGSWLYSDSKGMQSAWTLVQSDQDVISGSGTKGEAIKGSISGDSVSLTTTNSDGRSILTGTVTGETISGHYTNSISGTGSWTAVKTN